MEHIHNRRNIWRNYVMVSTACIELAKWKKVKFFFNNLNTLRFTIDKIKSLWLSTDNIEIYYGKEIANELWLQECKSKFKKSSTIIYGCKAYSTISNFHLKWNKNRLTNIIINNNF
jgi:hypothetical protein